MSVASSFSLTVPADFLLPLNPYPFCGDEIATRRTSQGRETRRVIGSTSVENTIDTETLIFERCISFHTNSRWEQPESCTDVSKHFLHLKVDGSM
ncbi:hypothetical protein VPH35_012880 [Triticum aestivum]